MKQLVPAQRHLPIAPLSFLQLKLPPPLYLLLGVGIIFLASHRKGKVPRPRWRWLGLPLITAGVMLDAHALLTFKRRGTTPNPFRPDKAGQIVSEGAYRFSRNPMYLGMALLLSGWSLLRTSWSGLLVVPAFIWTLTQVQIIPEEQSLANKFGQSYLSYKNQVRRWL